MKILSNNVRNTRKTLINQKKFGIISYINRCRFMYNFIGGT